MDKLAKAQKEPSAIVKRSSQDSAAIVAAMLMLAAQVTGYKEILPAETRLWCGLLAPYQPGEVEWAFQEYLGSNTYFPKPPDITALIQRKRVADRNEAEARKTDQLMAECREAREKLTAAGEPCGLEQLNNILKAAMAMVKTIPSSTVSEQTRQKLQNRMREVKERREKLKSAK